MIDKLDGLEAMQKQGSRRFGWASLPLNYFLFSIQPQTQYSFKGVLRSIYRFLDP